MASHAWGSANSLIEFVANPVTTETLRMALQNDVTGSSYIAWTLVRNGNRDVLPEALARALKVVDRPAGGDFTDLQGAAALRFRKRSGPRSACRFGPEIPD